MLIRWYLRFKDDKPITPSDRIKADISPDGTISLSINLATNSDAGVYVCEVSNEAGTIRSDANVFVSG